MLEFIVEGYLLLVWFCGGGWGGGGGGDGVDGGTGRGVIDVRKSYFVIVGLLGYRGYWEETHGFE